MSFIPQWNQYSAYAVGALVSSNDITYACILATPPSATPPASAPLVWSVSGGNDLPKGIFDYTAVSWTPEENGYKASVTGVSPFLTAGSQVSANVQLSDASSALTGNDVTLAQGTGVFATQPSSNFAGSITFWVNSISGADPRTAAAGKNFLSWSVVAF